MGKTLPGFKVATLYMKTRRILSANIVKSTLQLLMDWKHMSNIFILEQVSQQSMNVKNVQKHLLGHLDYRSIT